MNIEKKKNLINIIIVVVLIILVIIIFNFITENSDYKYYLPERTIGIIGSSDGPTTILLGREFQLMNFIKNVIFTITIISLFVLLIINIIGFIKSRKYSIKFKLKIVLSIDIFFIIMIFFHLAFMLLGIRFFGISILINFTLLTFIFIKEFLLKIVKHENEK